ncbi:MAG: phytanoyl-CoA dioxygenase family protein [Bacteroidia bacterium]
MIKQYGISEIKTHLTETEMHVENVALKGYTILKNVLSTDECKYYAQKSEEIYKIQADEFGLDNLKRINEENVVRCPLYYDEKFVKLIVEDKVHSVLKSLFNNSAYILHLQNVIINRPNYEHHQTSWHRDIPYQEYTTSKPVAINVFYCLSPFNEETGATKILPYSHLLEKFPSVNFAEENSIYVEANPGDVVIFNSWLYHRASPNVSKIVRYGINHVFTLPVFKQQIDLPALFKGKYEEDGVLSMLLGYRFNVPQSVSDYRTQKLKKSTRHEY